MTAYRQTIILSDADPAPAAAIAPVIAPALRVGNEGCGSAACGRSESVPTSLHPCHPERNDLTEGTEQSNNNTFLRTLGNTLFYFALIAIFIFALSAAAFGGGNRPIWGFFFYEVLTDSMQSTLPQGSLAVIRECDTEEIEIGDDIAFFRDKDFKVTHRVVGIIEDFDGQGQRGFETKGTDNPTPDEEVVHASNVIGKVAFSIPGFADTMSYVRNYWYILLIPTIALILTIALTKTLFHKEPLTEGITP